VRVLLTGRLGQVGWEIHQALGEAHEVVATDRMTLDLADPDAIVRTVREARPEVIFNAAAYTAVDRAETEPAAAMAINGTAPGVLAEEAKLLGALVVHFSTDYIFDGRKGSPYAEGDVPNPLNVYGASKLEGERRITASGARYLLLRTSWVYAPRGKNFFLAIANKALAGEPLRVVSDQQGVPTPAHFVATNTLSLIARQVEGTVNAVPTGSTTWHGFASEIVERLGGRVAVAAIASSDYATAARRPSYSVLDNRKLTRVLGPQPSWQRGLDRCIGAWKPQ
jgi:dTDP-4-dehydrorhamnose reductase